MGETLNRMMSLDGTVVQVLPGGTFRRFPGSVHAPEINMQTDDDGQILKEHDDAMMADVKRQGWDVQTGWTGQYSYSGPGMHESEFIGGSVEEHILETPGLWCALPLYVESEECPNDSPGCKLSDPCTLCTDGTGHDREQVYAGWVFMHRERPVPKRIALTEKQSRAPLAGTVDDPMDGDTLFHVTWEDDTQSVEEYATEGRDWVEVAG